MKKRDTKCDTKSELIGVKSDEMS